MLELINSIPRSLILPPSSLFLVILVGLLLWRRWPRAGRIVSGTGLALLAFLSTSGGANLFIAPLERMTAPLMAPERAGAQAIVVLAAGRYRAAIEYGGRDSPDYVALARLRYAAYLHRRTTLPLLVSGGTAGTLDPGEQPYSLAGSMASSLREDFRVPVAWLEDRSRDTSQNAAFSAAMLRQAGVRRILLVTDAMHMARSRAAFERAGLEVVDAPTMFLSGRELTIHAWVPSAEGMRRSWYAIYELLGLVWYRVKSGGSERAAPVQQKPAA